MFHKRSRMLAGASLAASLAAPLAVLPAAAAARPADTSLVAKGDQVIARTTRLRSLVIPAGATLRAPEGSSLTMTVDGVNVPVAAGSYRGDVTLTVTPVIAVQYKALPPHAFRAAIYVDDGRYVPGKSVAAAVTGGQVTDQSAKGVRIVSKDQEFNGIVVAGSSKYVIDAPVIDFTGNGGNDFAGFGAAIMSTGHADVIVNNAHITTRGAVRTAVFVGGDSVMHVNDSVIETFNGTLPADYKFTIEVGRMKEVPWMLGLRGNVRATNLVDNGTVYYTDSHIRSQGWGALSTDDSKRVRMYVKDCVIETVDSGYGAYSIGDSLDHFSHSRFDVADIALIMAAQGSGTFTDGTIVNSRRYGVMMHSGGSAGVLTIDKKSVFNTKSTAIEIKGRGGTVVVDDARIVPANGILLQAMVNDDPFAASMGPGGPIVGVQQDGSGLPDVGAGPPPGAPAGPPPGGPGGMPPAEPHPAVKVTFRNATLSGDVINSRWEQGPLDLTLERASLAGAVSTAMQSPVEGQAPTKETYYLIGAVTNRFMPATGEYGLAVALDGASTWKVTKTSYLTKLTLAPGAKLIGSSGSAKVTVDGRVVRGPGTYEGKVIVSPN